MISAIPAIIGAGASLLGGFINNEYAQARSDQQWDRMNYMQDKMNAYNAPTAQMARLRAAGLNPNLVYAHGGAVMESAVGNAPNPPNTAPIDTQGVLQMVQTIVGAMLEKDKIQAQKDMQSEQIQSNKEISEAKNTTTKEVTQMQNKSSERNVDVQTQSNENIAIERNKTEKEISDANRKENARQFNLSFEQQKRVDAMRLSIDRSLANSQIALHSSQIEINTLSANLSRQLEPFLVDKAKLDSLSSQFSFSNEKLDTFLSRPYEISVTDLENAYKDAGLSVPSAFGLSQMVDYHNEAVRAWNQEVKTNRTKLSDDEFYSGWMHLWNAISAPTQMATSLLFKKK